MFRRTNSLQGQFINLEKTRKYVKLARIID